jgi:CheY-like chemotaxis protein
MTSAQSPRRHRIVIADDGRDTADSLAALLTIMGHEVKVAYDGQEAVTVAATFRPDVMILDVGMPKLDGYQVARRVREEPWGRAVLLVAMTGWGRADDRRRAEESGFDRHFTKPADITELQQLLAGFAGARPGPSAGHPNLNVGPAERHPAMDLPPDQI